MPDVALGRPVVAGAYRLDARVRLLGPVLSAREAERVEGVPKLPIDHLQEGELCRRNDARLPARQGQDRHHRWRSEGVLAGDFLARCYEQPVE